MDTKIKQALWSDWLPGDMPEDCTFEMFCAARELLWHDEDVDAALRGITLADEILQSDTTNPIVRDYFITERKRLIGVLENG